MKLPEGVTVYIGGGSHKGEIPDKLADKLPKDLLRKVPESKKPGQVRSGANIKNTKAKKEKEAKAKAESESKVKDLES